MPGTTGAAFQNAFDTSQSIFAEYLTIEQNATVGPVFTDHLAAQQNAAHGAVSAFLRPPALPALQPITAGTTALTVNGTVTKAAGSFGAVTVAHNAGDQAAERPLSPESPTIRLLSLRG